MNATAKKIKPGLMSLLISIKDGTYQNQRATKGLNILEVEKLVLDMMVKDNITFEDLEKIHKKENNSKPFAFTKVKFNSHVKDACKVEAEKLRKVVEAFSQNKDDITNYGEKLAQLYHRIGASLVSLGYDDPSQYKSNLQTYNLQYMKHLGNLIEKERSYAAKLMRMDKDDEFFNVVPTILENIDELANMFVKSGIVSRALIRNISFYNYNRIFGSSIKQKYSDKLNELTLPPHSRKIKTSEKWHYVRDLIKDIACIYLKVYIKQIQRNHLNLKYLIEFHKLRSAMYISDEDLRSVYSVTYNELGMESAKVQIRFHRFVVVKLNKRYMKLKALKDSSETEKIDASFYEDKQDLKLVLGGLQSFSSKFAKEELCFNAHDLDAL